MNDDGGALSFATGVDTSGYYEGMQHMEEATQNLTISVEQQSSKIADLLNNIPEVNLSITTQASDLETIERGLQEVDRVVDANTKGIRELEAEYKRLGAEATKAFKQGMPEGDKAYRAYENQRAAIQQVIRARKKAIDEAEKEGDALLALEAKLKTQAAATQQNADKQTSLRQRLRELKLELVEMEASGQRGTAAYRALQEETARLTDAWGDAQSQANILANDQRGIAGIMSGLSGLSGTMTAATGAVSLFGSENEDLQKIMMRLQAVMSITMGLQQVQQTLNKDSAFSLVTLNKLKEWWNNLLATGAKEQVAATAAQEADTSVTSANAAAHEGKSAASVKAAESQNLHNSSIEAGTKVTKGLTTATNLLKKVIIATGIGALIAGIGIVISKISSLVSANKAAQEQAKATQEIESDAIKTYAEAKTSIEESIRVCKTFVGSKEAERKKVEELNSKHGETLGYHKSLAEWETTLINRGEEYCKMLALKAKYQTILNKRTDAYAKSLETAYKAEQGEFDNDALAGYAAQYLGGSPIKMGLEAFDTEAKTDAIYKHRDAVKAQADEEIEYWEKELKAASNELKAYKKEHNLDIIYTDNITPLPITPTFDPKAAAQHERDALKAYQEAMKTYIKQANDAVTADNIAAMDDGLKKDLAQSHANTDARIEQWKDGLRQLAKARRDYEHEVYMTQKGATEDGWEASDDGKKTDEDWMNEILADPKNAELAQQYQDQLTRIEEEGARERQRIQQEYSDALVEKYGTTAEKIEVLERKHAVAVNNGLIPQDYWEEAERQLDEQISVLKNADLKESLNWEEVFGNLDAVATPALQSIKKKLQDFVKVNKQLSPDAIKEIVGAIEKIDAKLDERDPFTAMCDDFRDLADATTKVKDAQKKYNEALANGTDEEKKLARAELDAALNVKQKALANASKSLKAAADQVKEFLNLGNEIVDCLESFGVEIPEELTGFLSGMGKAVDAIGSIDLTKPFSIISGAVGAISGIGSAIGSLFNHDSRHEKRIQKLQKQIEALDDAYSKLENQVDKVYSKDASKLIEQQNTMLKQQKLLIQQQINEENAKKDTDYSKIDAWEKQINEIDDIIAENKEKTIDAIFGEDLQSAIDNFASAYADAWASGTDKAQSAKDTVKQMMRHMVTESIKAAIQSSGAMERIRQKLKEFYADNVLSGWEQDYVYRMAEELQQQLDEQFSWANDLMQDDFEREGQSKGIATASQDSVDENNARLTTIQGHTYTINQGVQELNRTSNSILERLTGIESKAKDINDKLDTVNGNVKRIHDTVDEIKTQGIRLKN